MVECLNEVRIIGNVGRDPVLGTAKNERKYLRFSVATNFFYKDKKGDWQEATEWHRCVAWGRTAEKLGGSLVTGSRVFVSGELKNTSWATGEGELKEVHQIQVVRAFILDGNGVKKVKAEGSS